jgi:hypothetical protein
MTRMTNAESKAAQDAIHEIAKQAACKLIELNRLTSDDVRKETWDGKLFNEEGLPVPKMTSAILWDWDIEFADGPVRRIRVETRFGNLARGLCCDVVIAIGDLPDEAHHTEVGFVGPHELWGITLDSRGHLWQPEIWECGLQDGDMEALNTRDDPLEAAEPLPESVWHEALDVIERAAEQHARDNE